MSLFVISTRLFSDAALHMLQNAAPEAVFYQIETRNMAEIPAELLAQTDVLFTHASVPTRAAAPALRWIQCNFAGVDQLLKEPICAEPGLSVTTAAGVHAVTMSEYALMMMLSHAHKLPDFIEMKRSGTWIRGEALHPRAELAGATLGLIGYGAIGRETARLAQAFGMRVLALRGSDTPADAGVELVKREHLSTLLAAADYLVVLAPLTAVTRGMLGAAELAHLKPGAFIVNMARGALIDEPALIDALRSGHLGGAALDVFASEPLLADSPLWTLDTVILSPHIAGVTPRYEARVAALFADNLRRFVAGEPLRNQVDLLRGY